MIDLPPTLLAEVDQLVLTGMFASREAAVAELVRLGLDALRRRGSRPPPGPGRPPMPPGVGDPADDAPIHVDPRDPKWL